jgi:hypothetical protein
LLIVASGYVIRGGALTILISKNQTSDVKSPAKCHEWGNTGWPVYLTIYTMYQHQANNGTHTFAIFNSSQYFTHKIKL